MPTTSSRQATKDLCNLLGYAEEILKAGERVVSDLAKDAVVAFHEGDVATLEGVTVLPAGDETWLRIARLHELEPPPLPTAFIDWIVPPAPGNGPFVPPGLSPTCMVQMSIEDASDLVEGGMAQPDDLLAPKGDRALAGNTVDAFLRLENLPEFRTLFDGWVLGEWAGWDAAERPRRRSIAFYNRLFEIQQRSVAMGDDTPVEAVFGVGLARWAHPLGRVNAPLIEAAVELELDPENGALEVRPRPQPPTLALRAFEALDIASVPRLQRDASQQLERLHQDPDIGFSPHAPASFEQVLRMCRARLAADAVYEPDGREKGDRSVGVIDAKLRIMDSWVLYVRQRSSNFRCDDIRRLKAAVESADEGELPPAALKMTSRPSDDFIGGERIDLTGETLRWPEASLSAGVPSSHAPGAGGTNPEKTFFPLPYNDDQIEIARRLDQKDSYGVVVQGPPGTGKTHTIANIICHYMATGRRVLVSAHSPEALAAIQVKLPESIRDLAISVIHSDREGARKLEQAIDILAQQVKAIDAERFAGGTLAVSCSSATLPDQRRFPG